MHLGVGYDRDHVVLFRVGRSGKIFRKVLLHLFSKPGEHGLVHLSRRLRRREGGGEVL